MSQAELLRGRATCYLEWAAVAREHADLNATEYLTALATECFEEAAALDAAEGKSPVHTFSARALPKSGQTKRKH